MKVPIIHRNIKLATLDIEASELPRKGDVISFMGGDDYDDFPCSGKVDYVMWNYNTSVRGQPRAVSIVLADERL